MNIAQQLKAFHTLIVNGYPAVDITALIDEAEKIGDVTQDYDNEGTQIDFADGSCLVVWDTDVMVYGAKN